MKEQFREVQAESVNVREAEQTVQVSEADTKSEENKPKKDPVDHDRLFKQLIGTFFMEFMELFFPDYYKQITPGSLEEMENEIFTDVTPGEKHEVDLLRHVKVEGEPTKVIIHIEAQSSVKDQNFGKRMFNYFSRLTANHDEPVLPIVVFSFDTPERAEPKSYVIKAFGKIVNEFNFEVVQLNQMDWHNFVDKPNPIASAMMAKMKIAPEDRIRVKLECLKMMFGLELDDARNELIAGFVSTYLKLNQEEETMFEQEAKRLNLRSENDLELFWTDWHERGFSKGEAKGLAHAALIQLRRKLGEVPTAAENSIRQLETPQLEKLLGDLLDFTNLSQLEAWLEQNQTVSAV